MLDNLINSHNVWTSLKISCMYIVKQECMYLCGHLNPPDTKWPFLEDLWHVETR